MLLDFKPPEEAEEAPSDQSYSQIAGRSFRSQLYTGTSVGEPLAAERAYDELGDDVFKRTGVRLDNPVNAYLNEGNLPGLDPLAPNKAYFDASWDYYQRVIKLAGQDPALADLADKAQPNMVHRRANQISLGYAADLDEATRGRGWGATVAEFAGGAPASQFDPKQFVTNFLPMGASKSFLGAAARGALYNGVGAAMNEPDIQARREDLGLPHGLDQAAQDTAFAAGFGFLFGAGLHGAGVLHSQITAPNAAAAADSAMVSARAKAGGAVLQALASGEDKDVATAGQAIRDALGARDEAFTKKAYVEGSALWRVARAYSGAWAKARPVGGGSDERQQAATGQAASAAPDAELDPHIGPAEDLARKAGANDLRDDLTMESSKVAGIDLGDAARAVDEADAFLREVSDSPPEPPRAPRPATPEEIHAAEVSDDFTPKPDLGYHDEVMGGSPPRMRARTFTRFPAQDLQIDPQQFQYKNADALGQTGRLNGVEVWDPASSGKVFAWERADGQRFIADGHQRRALALRLMRDGHPQIDLDGFLYREADGWSAKDVRIEAAKKNLRETPGDPLDTAALIREAPDALDTSVPQTGPQMKIARGLARLSPEGWRIVRDGQVRPDIGAVVGHVAQDQPAIHGAILRDFIANPPRTQREAEFITREAMSIGARNEHAAQMGLFGDALVTGLRERADILSQAITILGTERRAFAAAEANAPALEQAGNVLAHDANARRVELVAELQREMISLASRPGPVADALKAVTKRVLDGELPMAEAPRAFADAALGLIEENGVMNLKRSAPTLPAAEKVPVGIVDPHAEAATQVDRLTKSTAQDMDDADRAADAASDQIERAYRGTKGPYEKSDFQYFTSDAALADVFAKQWPRVAGREPTVTAADLHLGKTLVHDAKGTRWTDNLNVEDITNPEIRDAMLANKDAAHFVTSGAEPYSVHARSIDALADHAAKAGYDSLTVRNFRDGGAKEPATTYVIMKGDQAKPIESEQKPQTFAQAAESGEKVKAPFDPFEHEHEDELIGDLDKATLPELQAIIDADRIAPGATLEGRAERQAAIINAWRDVNRPLAAVDDAGLDVRSTPEEVASVARGVFGPGLDDILRVGQMHIVPDVEGAAAPEWFKAAYRGRRVMGLSLPGQNAYIFSNHIFPTAFAVKGVIMHELGVHVGLPQMLGEDGFQQVIAQAERLTEGGDQAMLNARAMVPRQTDPWRVSEETLAYAMQHTPDAPLVQQLFASVRAWFWKTFPKLRDTIGLDVHAMKALTVGAIRSAGERAKQDLIKYGDNSLAPRGQGSNPESLYSSAPHPDAPELLPAVASKEAKDYPAHMEPAARQMEKDGKTPDEIWRATGLRRGVAGDRRFYFEMEGLKWKREVSIIKRNKRLIPLSDVIDFPKLFENYPEAHNIEVRFVDAVGGGSYEHPAGGWGGKVGIHTITLGRDAPKHSIMGTLEHEVDHFLKGQSGQSTGYNPLAARHGPQWKRFEQDAIHEHLRWENTRFGRESGAPDKTPMDISDVDWKDIEDRTRNKIYMHERSEWYARQADNRSSKGEDYRKYFAPFGEYDWHVKNPQTDLWESKMFKFPKPNDPLKSYSISSDIGDLSGRVQELTAPGDRLQDIHDMLADCGPTQ